MNRTLHGLVLLPVLLGASVGVHAQTCEQTFKAIGDARNGLVYKASRVIPGIRPEVAIGQLEGITKADKFTLGIPTYKDGRGELYFMSTTSRTPIVVRATAEQGGRVSLGFKLARGQTMDIESAKGQACGLLARIKAGAEGEALARVGRAGNEATSVIEADPVKLAAQLRKEIDRAMRAADTPSMRDLLLGTNTPRSQRADVDALFAPLRLRYEGRRYRLDGQVHTLSAFRGVGRVDFLVAPKRGLLQVQQTQGFSVPFSISCLMAPDQADYFNVLENGHLVKLDGTVDLITEHTLQLRDCRQAG